MLGEGASNFLGALAYVLDRVLFIYMWIIIIAALISWVNPDPYNPIVRFLHRVTEPFLRRIRRYLPVNLGIDFSPLIAILIILFIQKFLVATLYDAARRMR